MAGREQHCRLAFAFPPRTAPGGTKVTRVCAHIMPDVILSAKSTLLAAGEVSTPHECGLTPEEAGGGGIRLPER